MRKIIIIGLCYLMLSACNEKHTAASSDVIDGPSEKVPLAFLNDTTLFLGINNEFIFSSDRDVIIDTLIQDIRLHIRYDVQDEMLVQFNAIITQSQPEITQIFRSHYDSLSVSQSHFDNFHTWILPLNRRPLIEINMEVFTDSLVLSGFLRSHI